MNAILREITMSDCLPPFWKWIYSKRKIFSFSPDLNSSDSSRKKIFKEIFLFYHEIICCVYSLESPPRSDSNEYTQHTIIVQKIETISLNYRHLLPDLAPLLTLELPMSRTIFHGPKDVWAIEVRLDLIESHVTPSLWFSPNSKLYMT